MFRFYAKISTEQKEEQTQRLKQQADEAASTAALLKAIAADQAAAAAAAKPGPGRPRKVPVLLSPPASDIDCDPASSEPGSAINANKRAKIDWFARDSIHHILHVQAKTRSSSLTVQQLHRDLPHLYKDLKRSTINAWYDGNELKPQFAARLLNQSSSAAAHAGGEKRAFASSAEAIAAEEKIKAHVKSLRDQGGSINLLVTRNIMQAILETECPAMLQTCKLSNTFVRQWLHQQMNYSWRAKTTAAAHVPDNWKELGVLMAKRIAVNVHQYSIHSSLVINMDQTGIHLVPASNHTFAPLGGSNVAMLGADDKRQITCCIASSMNGDLLPLQLVFQAKTAKCEPLPG